MGQDLVPVREAGHHVHVLAAAFRQLLGSGGDVRLDGPLLRRQRGEGEPLRQIVAVPAGEDHPLDLGTVELVEVDVPQPAGLTGEVLAADGVHQHQHRHQMRRQHQIHQQMRRRKHQRSEMQKIFLQRFLQILVEAL